MSVINCPSQMNQNLKIHLIRGKNTGSNPSIQKSVKLINMMKNIVKKNKKSQLQSTNPSMVCSTKVPDFIRQHKLNQEACEYLKFSQQTCHSPPTAWERKKFSQKRHLPQNNDSKRKYNQIHSQYQSKIPASDRLNNNLKGKSDKNKKYRHNQKKIIKDYQLCQNNKKDHTSKEKIHSSGLIKYFQKLVEEKENERKNKQQKEKYFFTKITTKNETRQAEIKKNTFTSNKKCYSAISHQFFKGGKLLTKNLTQQKFHQTMGQKNLFNNLIPKKRSKLMSQMIESRDNGEATEKNWRKYYTVNSELKIPISHENFFLKKNTQQQSFVNIKKYTNLVFNRKQIELINPFSSKPQKQVFSILKKIKQNEESSLYIVVHRQTNFLYCMKKCSIYKKKQVDQKELKMCSQQNINSKRKNDKGRNNQKMDSVIREAKIAQSVNHPNLINTYCCLVDRTHIYHLMEYMQDQDLQEKIRRKEVWGNNMRDRIEIVRKYLRQILLAVSHLHQFGIIHRDIKPSNIFISHHDNLKLGDFGISLYQKPTDYYGTLDYISPEVLLKEQYNQNVDMWAIGCVAYQIYTGIPPFYHQNQHITSQKLISVRYNKSLIDHIELKSLINCLLKRQPQKRISCKQALKHPFFLKGSITE